MLRLRNKRLLSLPFITQRRTIAQFSPHLPPLPPLPDWIDHFSPFGRPSKEVRVFLNNPDTAFETLRAFGLDKDDGCGPKTVVEIYPGPGLLSRAILSLPRERIKKLVIVEAEPHFTEYLQPLQEADDRVIFLPTDGFLWKSYDEMDKIGTFSDIETVLDGSVHPNLRFIGQMPLSVHSEQLISQFIRNIPAQSWLWRFGRVPLHLIVGESVHQRLTAPIGNSHRCKLTILAETMTDIAVSPPPESYAPYADHFFPPSPVAKVGGVLKGKGKASRSRPRGNPMVAVNMIPKVEAIIAGKKMITEDLIDAWDFVLRQCFVVSSRPIKLALPLVAPGAAILLKNPACKHIDPGMEVRHLVPKDWSCIIKAFNEWPFRPTSLIHAELSDIAYGSKMQSSHDIY